MRERVLSWEVPGEVDAEAAFQALHGGAEHAFWLDTGAGRGTSYLGAGAPVGADELAAAGGVIELLRRETAGWDVDASAAPEGFALGLVGWLGYEVHAETLGLPAPHSGRYPEAMLLRVDRALAVDRTTGRARLLARGTGWQGGLARWRDATLAALATLGGAPAVDPSDGDADLHEGRAEVRWRHADRDYLRLIRECMHAIADGDAYVLCLTTEAEVAGSFDPWQVYRRLRRTSPSHHGGYLVGGGVALLSASPERFLAVDRAGRVETNPIKGTRPRGGTPTEDAALAAALRASAKERAENVMIVDLMRNDLARVCEVGSVETTRLLDVETYPQVHQLVSTVAGRLAPGRTAVDAIASCFPAGSMTGAPKRSAVSILSRLEDRSRGAYAGAFGYLGLDGALDLAMTIRSIVIDADGATVGTGGGITWLSAPEEELAEARLKAAALLQALGAPAGAAEGPRTPDGTPGALRQP